MKINKKIILLSSLLIGTLFFSTGVLAEDQVTEASTDTEIVNSSSIEENASTSVENSESSNSSTSASEEAEVISSKKVEKAVNDIIGEKVGDDVPVETSPPASEIRSELTKEAYGISKEELDKYTDEQLENTMTLFTRYNYDVTGMDYGSYAKLLKTLYVDKTVNVNDALTQLSFDPGSFSSFSAMIPRVAELQAYLKTLYPTNSSFLPGIERTDDQLIAKLEALQKMEDELTAQGKNLPFGRIAPLIEPDDAITESSDSTTSDSTVSTSSQGGKETPTSSSKKDGSLPQTGEQKQKLAITIIGILAIVAVAFFFFRKSRKK